MRAMILALFHDRKSLAHVSTLKGAMEACFGPFGLRAIEQGYLHVPLEGETLDAAKLLKYLQQVSGAHPALWLVDRELHYPGIGNVFGCSSEYSAVLSTAIAEPEMLIREGLHETGHLMGLEHCRRHCVMKLTIFSKREEKPSSLCAQCAARLETRIGL
jgi:predicted Zn-dependent protease